MGYGYKIKDRGGTWRMIKAAGALNKK